MFKVKTLPRLNVVQTAFGKDIAFSVRTFRFTDGQSTDDQNQTVTCEMHLEPAADVPEEQATDCTCYTAEECTGESDESFFGLLITQTLSCCNVCS